jgi:pimeloyl-ACP methyl ester carboxylesterase
MKRVDIAGTSLATVDQGDGSPLLLVHGFPLDHTMWNAQIEEFSGRWRVIAPDLRGFGQSGGAHEVVTMEEFAADLAALLDALDVTEPVVFCGLSMGGYIAWQFWRNFSFRLGALVLCDTRAVADTAEAAKVRRETAERVVREGTAWLATSMIEKLLSEATIRDRPEIVDAIRQTIGSANPQGVAAASRGMAQRVDATAWLASIDVPALVAVGQHDAISTVDEMRGIAGTIPRAQFAVIPDAGHVSPMENPRALNAAVSGFLEGLSQ